MLGYSGRYSTSCCDQIYPTKSTFDAGAVNSDLGLHNTTDSSSCYTITETSTVTSTTTTNQVTTNQVTTTSTGTEQTTTKATVTSSSTKTTTQPSTLPMTTEPPVIVADCDFEKDFCGYTRDKTSSYLFSWQRFNKKTEQDATGPSTDHTPGNDTNYFISVLSGKSMTATKVTSPELSPSALCIKFAYHSYGADQSKLELNVWQISGDKRSLLWSHTGSLGDKWNEVSVGITAVEKYKVRVCKNSWAPPESAC